MRVSESILTDDREASWARQIVKARLVPPRTRLVLAVCCGLLAAAMTARDAGFAPGPRDFGQSWFAARAVLAGANPYPLIGPGRAFDWPAPWLYPLPAALIAAPFAPFTELTAGMLFAGVGGACLAWALMAYGYGPLFGFFSLAVREAAGAAQWSPLFAASTAIPPLALILAAKPTIGAAMFIAKPSRWAVMGVVIVVPLAFLLEPSWVSGWMRSVREFNVLWAPNHPYRPIVRFPGGILVLLCLGRWRRSEARLIVSLACVPVTVADYETVPLLLVPQTFWQAATLVALSYAQRYCTTALLNAPWSVAEFQSMKGQMLVICAYLPATIMVLRRPNEGAIPPWLEQRLKAWPIWLRGRTTTA